MEKRVAVGSTNPAKIEAVRAVFAAVFPQVEVSGVLVDSGVDEQPRGHAAMRRGAFRRARAARAALDADFGVGIEAGVVLESADGPPADPFLPPYATGWTVIIDRNGRIGAAPSPVFPLPPRIASLLAAGEELGPLVDSLQGVSGSKWRGGFVGYMTAGAVDRRGVTAVSVALALAPFLRPELYGAGGLERFASLEEGRAP
ncbi:MAG TPA: inosine/xanthosine triphosphatase [Limnochordia bacterium]